MSRTLWKTVNIFQNWRYYWYSRPFCRFSIHSLVCYTAVFSVVTQCSSTLVGRTALRDDTKNGCVADYPRAAANSDIVMSSTYFQYEQSGEANFKSLIIITKSIGPNLVPWGTPARTGSQLETVCPSLTHYHRSVRKLQIHGRRCATRPTKVHG